MIGSKNGLRYPSVQVCRRAGSGIRLPWRQRLRSHKGSANSERESVPLTLLCQTDGKKSFVGGGREGGGRRSDATLEMFRLGLMKSPSQPLLSITDPMLLRLAAKWLSGDLRPTLDLKRGIEM